MNENTSYRPQPGESLGQYLKRLRATASEVQNRLITQDEVARMTTNLPKPQRFTSAWLSVTESDGYKHAGGDRLRTVAGIYARLLRAPIPAEWLLSLAGHKVTSATRPQSETVNRLLQDEDMLALVTAAEHLLKLGHVEDVRLLIMLAQRYINAHDPQTDLREIFKDPVLSAHVERFSEALSAT